MTGRVLPRAAGGDVFGTDAAAYHHARLGYSAALIDRVFDYAGTAHPAVVEIGPGTGLATRRLLDRPVKSLVAIEPDGAMAAMLRHRIADPRLQVIEAGFLDAPLPAADLAAAACSFHWVDPKRGYARLRTIVRPGGTVALWWHSYRNAARDPFFAALEGSLRGIKLPPSEGPDGYVYLDEARQRDVLRSHGFGDVEFELARTERSLDADGMRALYASFSFVRLLPDDARQRLLDRIADLVETRFSGQAPNVVLTPLYLARCPANGGPT